MAPLDFVSIRISDPAPIFLHPPSIDHHNCDKTSSRSQPVHIMVKPLTFKGEKKPKKRKRAAETGDDAADDNGEPHIKSSKASKEEDPENPDDDDGWVSAEVVTDLVGPVMFVLPSEPPTALACDANGKVFALPIENIIDGNPATSEPHDVRQVWVANRIVGTEHYRFKGHHGKYILSSTSKKSNIQLTRKWEQVFELRQDRPLLRRCRSCFPA